MASSAPCLPLAWRDVDDVLAAWGDQPGFVCLDSGGPVGPRARWTIICRDPAHWIEQRDGMCWLDGTQVAHDLPGLLRQCVPGGCCPPEVPFAGGAIGFIGYGAGQRMEGIGTRHGQEMMAPRPLSACMTMPSCSIARQVAPGWREQTLMLRI